MFSLRMRLYIWIHKNNCFQQNYISLLYILMKSSLLFISRYTIVGLLCVIMTSLHGQVKTKGMKHYQGFYDFYYSTDKGKVYLMVEKEQLNQEFLYLYGLTSGVGSNDIGLDRGQMGREQVVYFEKAGNKLLLIQPNLRYRAETDNVLERKSVKQAFARSVRYGFEIKDTRENGYLIDITSFLMQDAHGVSERLTRRKQGTYKVDNKRSAVTLDHTRAFVDNVEFEALLTFTGKPKGSEIYSVAPDARYVSVVLHHSFIRLPDNNYRPRPYDPRSGALYISYADYASPIIESIEKKWIRRHRLEKKNPSAEMSEAIEPIIYYLDNGTPEPVRSALLDGARWWNEAFEAIGYENAYQVRILPDDADPMDVRYNVIQWVHRSTRGWSYGRSIIDPRTGEIIKGHVSLGSLRIRQDYLIAQALSNRPFTEQNITASQKRNLDFALARIRQLSAHEVGHTLGFAHNFAASTNDRASVMDYPHPLFRLKNGEITSTNAYDTQIGEWDKYTVAYSYSDFGDAPHQVDSLRAILAEAQQNGLRYITDADARPRGGAHAYAHLWDNGADATEEMKEVMAVRQKGMQQFSKYNVLPYQSHSTLEDVFVPLYLFHRYQTEAVVKSIAGVDYSYSLRDDGQDAFRVLEKSKQSKALSAVIATLAPEVLAIPKHVRSLFPPRLPSYSRTRESLKGRTGVTFDALSAASTAADMTLGLLLHPERASRLVHQQAVDKSQLGLSDVFSELFRYTLYNNYESKNRLTIGFVADMSFDKTDKDKYLSEIAHVVNVSVLTHLMRLHADTKTLPQVQAYAMDALKKVKKHLEKKKIHRREYRAQYIDLINGFMKNPKSFKPTPQPKIPDGSPIGSCQLSHTSTE